MKNKFLLFVLLASFFIHAQVTLKVTSIPSNTPAGATIFVAGGFNGWDPSGTPLVKDSNGNYLYTIPEGTGTVEYKFTRGSWTTVEGNENGQYLPNRSFTFTGSPQTLNLTIKSWEDLGGTNGSTAAANVHILSNSFFMPQLNRNRKIWIYLPPDYETSSKNYPVLYMEDGQNLFDNLTSFAGEWQVDETLNTLFQQGDYGAIVIGIDNGGGSRIDEYTPWVNTTYGGGEGDAYITFVAETLKPYVDSHYRTRPEARYNALIGSSLGALISTYGGVKYSNTFQKIGALSPAYWIVSSQLNSYIENTPNNLNAMRIYHVAGSNESSSMVSDINNVVTRLKNKGLTNANSMVKLDSYGQHNENYWKGEFGALYKWLFQNEIFLNTSEIKTTEKISILAENGSLYISGLKNNSQAEILDMSGKILEKRMMENGWNHTKQLLPKGVYILKIQNKTEKFLVK